MDKVGEAFLMQTSNLRACNACRSRKIRCDKESPCSHCISAGVECTYNDSKPKEKRTRILLSHQYERKIDHLDDQLEVVIGLLKDLKSGKAPMNPLPQSNTSSPSPTPRSYAAQPECPTGPGMQGDSSLTAHSVFANDFMQRTVGVDSVQGNRTTIRETLDALSRIVSALKQQAIVSEMTYPHAASMQRPHPSQRILPPIQKAVALIRIANTQRLAGAGWIYQFLSTQRFPDICLGVYFSENYSEADFITVNAGLQSLFRDYATDVAAEEKDEYMGYARVCCDNLETALSNLPLHLSATSGMIVALLFGAYHAVEISKPLLSWTLSSKASELCQTLGYHRVGSNGANKYEDVRYKQFLFWSAYLIDKTLSLRLGRASTISDWDITTPQLSTSDSNQEPALIYFALSVRAARLQGSIYEMLYSPGSMVQPGHVRQYRVNSLVSALMGLEEAIQETNDKWLGITKAKIGEDLTTFFLVSDQVLRLSILTLVYRAAPRPADAMETFSPDCVGAARATLERHRDCMIIIDKRKEAYFGMYVHWTLLFAPFVPFIVMFWHVVETKDQRDLDHLNAFVLSIQSAPKISEAAAKMHWLFQALYRVAFRYIEFCSSIHQAEFTQYSAEMSGYIATMGFPPIRNDSHRQDRAESSQDTGTGPQEPAGSSDVCVAADGINNIQVENIIAWVESGALLDDWFNGDEVSIDLSDRMKSDSG